LRRKSFASSRVVEPHLVTFLELMSCGFVSYRVFIFSVLRLIRSRAKLCTSSKRAWRFCTYSSGDEGVSEGDQTAGHKGRRRSRPKKHLGW
ncbi:hypothetical protein TNCV_3458671, partial [Trichonephila clavipes]